MEAVILSMAGIRKYDDHTKALYVLEETQKNKVLEKIQKLQTSREPIQSCLGSEAVQQLQFPGLLIIIEGYATIQKTGRHQQLINETVTTEATGNHPNSERLYRQVLYFDELGILGLRVVYTTNPLKRIVYEIANGEITEAHV